MKEIKQIKINPKAEKQLKKLVAEKHEKMIAASNQKRVDLSELKVFISEEVVKQINEEE